MSSEAPLYERDPQAWAAHLSEGNARQARKRVGADVLISDDDGNILLVNPGYKPNWDLPGGMAEGNESPWHAAHRELNEELGLDLEIGSLLCLEWVPPHGPWDDSLMFIFDGGVLDEDAIAHLHIVDGELTEFRFCAREVAERLLRPRLWKRVLGALKALDSGSPVYLQDGGTQYEGT